MSASDRELISLHDELAKASRDALSEQSPLMAYVLERFGRNSSRAVRAQSQAFLFMIW
jgi:hypothetical protein